MSLSPGTRLGPYEIASLIGAGGMGEVYRGRDTRLGRDVAIKVLPPAFAQDAERRARFEREAKTVATLSHPHIVSLFDTGEHDGQVFVVMELLDGETLRERLTGGGALPVRKAVEYGVQVARGLAAAHDKGLVHRDLKPDNIFLLADGHVKILDFGLARSAAADGTGSGATETVVALTDPGLVMGTIGYMSPEQARGKAADGRADLFAFGAVLYEMVTGTRAFQRDTPADTMTAILKEDPPELASARPDLPPALDRIVRHCLEKNPAERFQSARDVAFALEALSGSAATTAAAVATPGSHHRFAAREIVAWAIAAIGVVSAGATILRRPEVPVPPSPSRFAVTLPGSAAALSVEAWVAPDGHGVVVRLAGAPDSRLRLRRLDSNEIQLLEGTAGAMGVFWSPDSRSIGFIVGRALKRFDFATSSVATIATLDGPYFTPAWGRDGTILLATQRAPLHRIPATGGTPQPIGTLDANATELMQFRPVFLEDGRRFFYVSIRAGEPVTVLGSLDSDRRAVLAGDDIRILFADERHVVFRRGEAIYAQPLDLSTPALTGEPTQLAEDLEPAGVQLLRESASGSGLLAFMPRANRGIELAWYGRDGRRLGSVGEPGHFTTFDLSHDGRQIVTGLRAGTGANLWTIDAERGTRQRITLGDASDVDPRWSPDGTRVIFGSLRDPARSPHIVGLAADAPTVVWKFDGRMYSNDDWSRDGRWLLYHDVQVPAVLARALDPAGKPQGDPVVVARALAGILDQAQMSPDGKWVAYNSDESGQSEVYVVPFPATGTRVSVTRGGGSQPTWNGKGDELYFLTPDRILKGVKVTTSAGVFQVGEPFEIARPRLVGVSASVEQYAPHPSGTKFLVLDRIGDDRDLAVGILLNWRSLLGK